MRPSEVGKGFLIKFTVAQPQMAESASICSDLSHCGDAAHCVCVNARRNADGHLS